MYRAAGGRFGTIPHVCSYEGPMGEHREAALTILSLPLGEEIAKYHWPIFRGDPPAERNPRTLWITVFGVEGQSLVQAKSRRQLSRAWVRSILGI